VIQAQILEHQVEQRNVSSLIQRQNKIIQELLINQQNVTSSMNRQLVETQEQLRQQHIVLTTQLTTAIHQLNQQRNSTSVMAVPLDQWLLVTGLDCADIIRRYPLAPSGLYRISGQAGGSLFQAYCDMETTGGGWTVFQRRIDGSESFYRTWSDYAGGFGNPAREFWLGNDRLAMLTAARPCKLRVDVIDWSGNSRYTEYSPFRVSASSDRYRLTVGSYSGNAGASLTASNGHQFSTYDQDNDVYTQNFAQQCRGAWWYRSCLQSNLNGEYNNTVHCKGVYWGGTRVLQRSSEMKIRPVSF